MTLSRTPRPRLVRECLVRLLAEGRVGGHGLEEMLKLNPLLLGVQKVWDPSGHWTILWRGLGKWPRKWACRAEVPGGLTGGPNSQGHQKAFSQVSQPPLLQMVTGGDRGLMYHQAMTSFVRSLWKTVG